jgi:hypothetical protein
MTIRSKWKSFKGKVRYRWRRAKNWVWPEKDNIERYIDAQLQEINEAEGVKEDLAPLFAPEEPEEEPEDSEQREMRLFSMNTEKRIAALQPRSIVLTYKSAKALERLTRVLIVLTFLLGILTAISIIALLRG